VRSMVQKQEGRCCWSQYDWACAKRARRVVCVRECERARPTSFAVAAVRARATGARRRRRRRRSTCGVAPRPPHTTHHHHTNHQPIHTGHRCTSCRPRRRSRRRHRRARGASHRRPTAALVRPLSRATRAASRAPWPFRTCHPTCSRSSMSSRSLGIAGLKVRANCSTRVKRERSLFSPLQLVAVHRPPHALPLPPTTTTNDQPTGTVLSRPAPKDNNGKKYHIHTFGCQVRRALFDGRRRRATLLRARHSLDKDPSCPRPSQS